MNRLTDQQLLRDYAERRSEAAFAELVRRHVDLIYSAALRMVCDSHLAEDVTQGAFVALARSAPQLAERAVLSGWLHRTAQNIAAQTVRTDVRRRAREQEAAAMNELLAPGADAAWEHIAPHLDAALGELSEADRDALMLRYFEHKSAQEMAHVLGVSDEAAQKRVSRAVERLREFFAKRGITIGASGLVVVISSNAIQAAPVGLAAAILAAASGITVASTATATVITMNWIHAKTAAAMAAAALVAGTGTYVVQQQRVRQLETAQRRSLAQEAQALTSRDDALAALKGKEQEMASLRNATADLPRLRNEITQLRQEKEANQSRALTNASPSARPAQAAAAKPIEPGKYISRDELFFAGYATPEAAEQSLVWGMAFVQYDTITNSFDPDVHGGDPVGDRGRFEKELQAEAPAIKGMQILARKRVSDEKVQLKVKYEDASGTHISIQSFRKVGNEWKRGNSSSYSAAWDQTGTVESLVENR